MISFRREFPALRKVRSCLCAATALWMFSVCSDAAEYYIDYTDGSDANEGTSRGAAWKHCPAMQPFSGSYKNSAGDRFIFKGGVTWPNAALPLKILKGGSSTSVRDYYGVDLTWYTGPEWTRPVFDGEGLAFTNQGGNRGNVIWIQGSSTRTVGAHIEIDNIEIKNFVWSDQAPTSITDGFSVYCENTNDIVMRNLYIHDWVVKTTTDGKFGGPGNLGSTSLQMYNCTVKGPTTIDSQYVTRAGWNASGSGATGIQRMDACDISGVSQGIWNGKNITNTSIHDGGQSYSAGDHTNGVWLQNSATFANNRMSNLQGGIGCYFLPAWNGNPGVQRIYNNIFEDMPQIQLTNEGNDSGIEIWFVNNVVKSGSQTCINLGTPKTVTKQPFAKLVVQNNIFISSAKYSLPDKVVNVFDPAALGPDYRSSHNVVYTPGEVMALGLVGRDYKPPGILPALLGTGTDKDISSFVKTDRLGEQRIVGEWDIGPYALGTTSGAAPAPPSGFRVVEDN